MVNGRLYFGAHRALSIPDFFDIPVNAKPLKVRMGKAEASTAYRARCVPPAQILYERQGICF